MPTLTIRLPQDLDERLKAYAEKEERTRTWVISKALEGFLGQGPDLEELPGYPGSLISTSAVTTATNLGLPGRRCSCGGTENIMGHCSKCNQKDKWEE